MFFSLDVLPPTCHRDATVSLLGSHTVQPVVPVLDSHRGIITTSTCISKHHGMMEEGDFQRDTSLKYHGVMEERDFLT